MAGSVSENKLLQVVLIYHELNIWQQGPKRHVLYRVVLI